MARKNFGGIYWNMEMTGMWDLSETYTFLMEFYSETRSP